LRSRIAGHIRLKIEPSEAIVTHLAIINIVSMRFFDHDGGVVVYSFTASIFRERIHIISYPQPQADAIKFFDK
jgi:hypothetical protein